MSYENQLRSNVVTYLKDNGIKVSWLAEQLGISRTLLHNKLNGVNPLRLNEVQAIEEVLKHKFVSIK